MNNEQDVAVRYCHSTVSGRPYPTVHCDFMIGSEDDHALANLIISWTSTYEFEWLEAVIDDEEFEWASEPWNYLDGAPDGNVYLYNLEDRKAVTPRSVIREMMADWRTFLDTGEEVTKIYRWVPRFKSFVRDMVNDVWYDPELFPEGWTADEVSEAIEVAYNSVDRDTIVPEVPFTCSTGEWAKQPNFKLTMVRTEGGGLKSVKPESQ